MRSKRMLVAGLCTAAAIATTVGVASAVWSSSGTGSAAGGATIAQGLVVTPFTPSGSAASLYPGGPAGPAYFTVQNPNPYAVNITGYQWGTPVSSNPTACPSSNVSVDSGAPTTVSTAVPANTTSSPLGVNGVLDLAHSAPNGCQGVSFTVPLTVTATQQ